MLQDLENRFLWWEAPKSLGSATRFAENSIQTVAQTEITDLKDNNYTVNRKRITYKITKINYIFFQYSHKLKFTETNWLQITWKPLIVFNEMGQEEAVTKLSCRIQEALEGGKKRRERKGKRRIFNEVISIFCFPEWVHKEKCPRPGKGDRPWHQPGKNRENLSAAAQAGVTGSCGPVVQPQHYTPATPVWPAAEASVSPCANT